MSDDVDASGSTPSSALDALLAIEHEVASRLAAAEREAEELVAAARAESASVSAEAASALERELARLHDERRVKREALVASIEAAATARTNRWRAIDGPAAQAVAERLAARVVGAGGAAT